MLNLIFFIFLTVRNYYTSFKNEDTLELSYITNIASVLFDGMIIREKNWAKVNS